MRVTNTLKTKAKLVELVAQYPEVGSKAAAGKLLDRLFSDITALILENGEFRFPHFGTFRIKPRQERRITHVLSGEQITIPKRMGLAFKPAKSTKSVIQRYEASSSSSSSSSNSSEGIFNRW